MEEFITADDVLFLLNQIGYVVSHGNTGDAVVKSAQQNLKTNLSPALKTREILEATDQILKYAAAAQVPATFIPAPFNLADYEDTPKEADPVTPPEPEPTPPPEEVPPLSESEAMPSEQTF